MLPTPLLPLTKSPPKAKMPPQHGDGHSPPSPRKAKQLQKSNELRGLEFTTKDHVNILPGNYAESHSNGTGTLQDMLLFDQKLRDAAPMSQLLHPKLNLHDWNVSPDKHGGSADPSLTLLASNKVTFEILTSDRGQRVVSSLVKQWEADKHSDNGRSLWAIVETFFSSLPYVFVREGDMHSKLVLRYVSALSALKEVIVQGLFCSNVSASMAVTATLTPTHNEKIPLYWYCHQLEREVQLLKNSTTDQSWEMVHSSDIGLLQEATANVLLNFWKLPKRERMAFLVQVFSNVSEIEVDLVRVLLDNSTYILQRVLEDLGFEAKVAKQPQAKLSTIGAVVSMSVQASNQARQLHKWRKHMRDDKQKNLEPIQVRHKGIQVNGGIESDDTLGRLDSPPPRTPNNRIRRSVITSDKSLKLVLMQDYQPFGRRDHPHLLTKDMWTVSTYSENLVHHLHAFIEYAKDTSTVPAEVVLVATMLLEWLMHEKLKATYHAKDLPVHLLDSAHFKQCAISLLDLFKSQPDTHVPDHIKAHATSIGDFLQRRDDTSDSIPRPKAIVEATSPVAPIVTPADIRAFLRKGFPADVVNQILSITSEEVAKEKESKTLLLIEQLEHHMMDKLQHHPAPTKTDAGAASAKPTPSPAGFGESTATTCRRRSNAHNPRATPTVVKTLTDQVKALLTEETDGKSNDEKASALLMDFVTSTQHKRGDDGGSDRAKMLDIESLCSVLEKKVELELQAGPLNKATRARVATLQKFINKLVPEAPSGVVSAKAAPKAERTPELSRLLDQALSMKQNLDKGVAAVLETIHMVLAKTQSKLKSASVDACLNTMVDSLQAAGDEWFEPFCTSLDDIVATLKTIVASSADDDSKTGDAKNGQIASAVTCHAPPTLNIDNVVNDERISAIPRCLVELTKQLQSLVEAGDSAKSHQGNDKTGAPHHHASVVKNGAALMIPPTQHHQSLSNEAQPMRVRKVPGLSQPGLQPGTLWENTRMKKPNVLGISATELSEMFVENKTVLNVGTVHKLIYQIYCERYECNLTEQDNPNTTAFIDFVYDWYLRKYGLRKLAMQHLSKLLLSLKKQKKKSKKAVLFCRFLGLFPPLFDYSALNFALGLLNVWTNGTFAVLTTANPVPLSTMHIILDDGYDRRFGPFCTTAFVKERLARNACVDDPSSIDQDVALEIALEEYVKMKTSVEAMLEDIYKAGDINGDDKMGFDEFATVVRNLAPCVSDREIVKMFKEALLDPTFVTITKQRFVNVIIDQGVLSSRVNKFKVPSGANNSTTFPEYENEQFELLEESWRSHEADIVKTIESIPHKETSTSLLLRVKILNMIIAKRIDSETAWLSHRMILRDIHRFKDLNEGAISEIKQKEEYFKEAVTRIMTSKFGLFRDVAKTHQPRTATIGDRSSAGVVDFVQQMDESKGSDDVKEEDESDMARLEDSLRSEMLNMANGSSDSILESQLDLYDNAVKKVRRMSMSKTARAVKKLGTLMKMAKLVGSPSSAAVLTEESESAVDEDDDVI